jgi:histidine ammonia-lyase
MLMKQEVTIDGESLTLDDVVAVANGAAARVAPAARAKVETAQRAVERFLARSDIIYGVTTGFGHFKDKIIPPDQVQQLQRNIVMSHSVGVGEPLDEPTVRVMMLIRANTLAKGFSGIRLETLDALIELLNRGVHPIVPQKGSLGASGDLAPLAHMSLVLIGEGEATYRGERLPGGEALRRAGLTPLVLEAKEGLALTNGTAMSTAIAALVVHQAEELCLLADIAGAMSLEALEGTAAAFDPRIQAVRPHPGQAECAAHVRQLIEGSELLWAGDTSHRAPRRSLDPEPLPEAPKVQDAYTLRCIPQVHGAVREAVAHARHVIEIELNAATDNPLIFVDGDKAVALSGGNFHGEPVALAMDYLAIALTDLGNIAERRLARLTDEASNLWVLPPFLIKHGGLNSGFMLVQYTAAALAAENKVLAHPASADSIPTSANVEDHVSMSPIAARQTREIANNVATILALELFAAAQAIDFRREQAGRPLRLGRGTGVTYEMIRRQVPFLEHDAIMYPYIEAVRRMIESGELVRAVEAAIA